MLLSSWTLAGVRLVPRDMKSWLYIVILYSTEVVRRSQAYKRRKYRAKNLCIN